MILVCTKTCILKLIWHRLFNCKNPPAIPHFSKWLLFVRTNLSSICQINSLHYSFAFYLHLKNWFECSVHIFRGPCINQKIECIISDVFSHFVKHIKFSSGKKVKHNSSEFLVMKILSVVQAVFVLGVPIFCPLGFPLNQESQFFLGHQ